MPGRREEDTFTFARAGRWWRRECTPHSKHGWLWLQVTVQDNSVIAFNGCCFRAILEQCMNYALSELEARHHRKELAIMERMEQLELAWR